MNSRQLWPERWRQARRRSARTREMAALATLLLSVTLALGLAALLLSLTK